MSNIPLATITMFQGSSIPAGWVVCNGQQIDKGSVKSSTTFENLQKALGETVGGNTLSIPKFNQCFMVGIGTDTNNTQSTGVNPADNHVHALDFPVKTFTTDLKGSHNHDFPSSWYMHHLTSSGSDNNDSFVDAGGYDVKGKTTTSDGNHNHSLKVAFETFDTYIEKNSNGGSDWQYPKYYALNFIMYVGDLYI